VSGPIFLFSGYGALSPVVKQLGCEADHSCPSDADFKNGWSCIFTPLFAFERHAQGHLYLCWLIYIYIYMDEVMMGRFMISCSHQIVEE